MSFSCIYRDSGFIWTLNPASTQRAVNCQENTPNSWRHSFTHCNLTPFFSVTSNRNLSANLLKVFIMVHPSWSIISPDPLWPTHFLDQKCSAFFALPFHTPKSLKASFTLTSPTIQTPYSSRSQSLRYAKVCTLIVSTCFYCILHLKMSCLRTSPRYHIPASLKMSCLYCKFKTNPMWLNDHWTHRSLDKFFH